MAQRSLGALRDALTEFREAVALVITSQASGAAMLMPERIARQARDRLLHVIADTPIGPSESFEMAAADFYAATGMMAPGKDDVTQAHAYAARIAAWDAWCAGADDGGAYNDPL